MTLVNSGFFADNNHNRIEVPSKMIKIGEKEEDFQYFTLECESLICPSSSIVSDSRSECATNVFKLGSTRSCKVLAGPPNEICSINEVPGLGTIVSVSNADFFIDSKNSPFRQISLKEENRILINEGNLVCKNMAGQKLESRFISAPSLHSSKIGYVHKNLDPKGMQFEETNSALSHHVSDLQIMSENLDLDHLSKTGYSLPTIVGLAILACLFTQFFLACLCLTVCYRRNRKTIDRKMRKMLKDFYQEHIENS